MKAKYVITCYLVFIACLTIHNFSKYNENTGTENAQRYTDGDMKSGCDLNPCVAFTSDFRPHDWGDFGKEK